MRTLISLLIGLAAMAALGAVAWMASAPRPLEPALAEAASAPGNAEAGRIVFHAAGCASCHQSPGQPNPLRLGGGQELKTQFGSFYAPNISSDPIDGIGAWSGRDFAEALLDGVSPKGEHYYPAFPYPSYRRMPPADVRDLFAYLRTLPPVAGRALPHALVLPFTLRGALGLWKRLYLGPRTFADAPARDASWKLGRYLVEGPGRCGECHSPRDLLGAVIAHRRLTGGSTSDGKDTAPDITAVGLADWSKADIVEALESGRTPKGETFGGAMAEVVRDTAELPPAYREAIADYLKSLTRPGWWFGG